MWSSPPASGLSDDARPHTEKYICGGRSLLLPPAIVSGARAQSDAVNLGLVDVLMTLADTILRPSDVEGGFFDANRVDHSAGPAGRYTARSSTGVVVCVWSMLYASCGPECSRRPRQLGRRRSGTAVSYGHSGWRVLRRGKGGEKPVMWQARPSRREGILVAPITSALREMQRVQWLHGDSARARRNSLGDLLRHTVSSAILPRVYRRLGSPVRLRTIADLGQLPIVAKPFSRRLWTIPGHNVPTIAALNGRPPGRPVSV